ncbi:hypothetical protein GCM10009555_030000 [Acrocarpospora macrocephala]|uniref:Uncharacterized protein n=1 Tax=Acrocarpospora macrocephala TaxID=150177 RepID=A0A5M3X865_9ACTN|nr:hypothetical protein Amac_086900 [Acrocarpospora macrocephala]
MTCLPKLAVTTERPSRVSIAARPGPIARVRALDSPNAGDLRKLDEDAVRLFAQLLATGLAM